ncbi:MAG: methylcobalamin:coenzyme M methyltransferase [Lentisphaerae bacterium ADurb.BinA184]|nr:MAG: methylcobalamin:coenzyme M methyltransferase [Lentisphaerae bacterium ADurb.BinA184]
MPSMTTHERVRRTYEHQEPDRIPICDSPWGATIERWQREGMPADVPWVDYFDLDRFAGIGVDNSPRYPSRTLEETDEYVVATTAWGATLRNFKHAASVPEFLAFKVTSPEAWREAKARMTPARDRVNWDYLRQHYRTWREQGHWIQAQFWFGFDVAHAWMVGTERFLMALAEDPEWCVDVFNTYLDLDLAMFQQVWDEGYRFDAIGWPDDMGYKHNQFFSLGMYRELLKPVHKRAADWAHAKGLKVHLHSCGDIRPFIPDLIEIGIDALNPLEVKAGMDPVQIKQAYGERLVLHGGVNAVLWDRPEAIEAEMERVIPALKRGGGYIFASDHSIPSSVSLADFTRIIERVKRLGRF